MFDARVHKKKEENKTIKNHLCAAWRAVPLPDPFSFSFSYHFFSACASAFLQIFSLTISLKVTPPTHCMLLVAQPIRGLYPSPALHNHMLSCLQFHALEPLYLCAWWLLRELILILVRTVSEWDRDMPLERRGELPTRVCCWKELGSCRGR